MVLGLWLHSSNGCNPKERLRCKYQPKIETWENFSLTSFEKWYWQYPQYLTLSKQFPASSQSKPIDCAQVTWKCCLHPDLLHCIHAPMVALLSLPLSSQMQHDYKEKIIIFLRTDHSQHCQTYQIQLITFHKMQTVTLITIYKGKAFNHMSFTEHKYKVLLNSSK